MPHNIRNKSPIKDNIDDFKKYRAFYASTADAYVVFIYLETPSFMIDMKREQIYIGKNCSKNTKTII